MLIILKRKWDSWWKNEEFKFLIFNNSITLKLVGQPTNQTKTMDISTIRRCTTFFHREKHNFSAGGKGARERATLRRSDAAEGGRRCDAATLRKEGDAATLRRCRCRATLWRCDAATLRLQCDAATLIYSWSGGRIYTPCAPGSLLRLLLYLIVCVFNRTALSLQKKYVL